MDLRESFINNLRNKTSSPLINLLNDKVLRDIELEEKYNNVLLKYLIQKNGIGVIDQLFLNVNKLDVSLSRFMSIQTVLKNGYIEIIGKTSKHYLIRITIKGRNAFNPQSITYRIKSANRIYRIKRYVLNLIWKIWSTFFVSPNNFIKIIIESGIIKLISFIITLVLFIIKWDDITKFFRKIIVKMYIK